MTPAKPTKKEAKQAAAANSQAVEKGPKKPPNEFIFFMKMKGSEMAKKMASELNLSYKECISKVSEIYNGYSEAEKAQYKAAREED